MATVRTHHPLDILESRRPSREIEWDEVFPWLLEPTGSASGTAPDRPLGLLAGPTLRFMDWVGNAPHGIPLPYNYWPERRWHEAFARRDLTPAIWLNKLGLDPTPATWFFDRSLHFVARLDKV